MRIILVVAESIVMHQSCCLEPKVKVAGSLVTGNALPRTSNEFDTMHERATFVPGLFHTVLYLCDELTAR